MEEIIKKIGLFIPLAIAAAYFVFLIASWNKFLQFQQSLRTRIDEYLDGKLSTHEPGVD